MDSDYSPNILIYLEVNRQRIRLADVLHDTATLFEPVSTEIASNTSAQLIFVIDDLVEQHDVVLNEGIHKDSYLITFTSNISISNGPYNNRVDVGL